MGLREAYSGALGGSQEGTQGVQPQSQAPLPRTPEMENPTTQEGGTYFLDPSMLPQGHQCEVGEELMVKMKVKSIGSKIGLTPIEVMELNNPVDATDESETGGEQV